MKEVVVGRAGEGFGTKQVETRCSNQLQKLWHPCSYLGKAAQRNMLPPVWDMGLWELVKSGAPQSTNM